MSAVAVLRTLCLFANGTYEINEEGLAPGQSWVRGRPSRTALDAT